MPTPKPPLVLIHGFRGAPVGLAAISRELEKAGYLVYTPAIPPFAGAKPLASYTPRAYADFIASYIKDQRLAHPILIGHSMGSIVAAATATYYPELLGPQLFLLSPISVKPNAFFRAITPLSSLLSAGLIDHLTTRFLFVPKDRALYRHTIALTHDCSHDHIPPRSITYAAAKFSAGHAITDFDLKSTYLANPHHRLILIAGAKDRLISQKSTEALAKSYGITPIFLENTGHLHNYEQPHETALAILQCLKTP